VAAQQDADVKQNDSVAASSVLEFNSTEPMASNLAVLHCAKRFQGKSGEALGWNGDLGYITRVHGQEFNSFRQKTRSKSLHEFLKEITGWNCEFESPN